MKYVFVVVTTLALAACNPSPTRAPKDLVKTATMVPQPTPTEQPETNYENPTYLVTKSTGLYIEPDADSDYTAELSVGTELQPAYGAMDCVTFADTYDPTTKFTMCQMKVVSTGKIGWVLKKWIAEK